MKTVYPLQTKFAGGIKKKMREAGFLLYFYFLKTDEGGRFFNFFFISSKTDEGGRFFILFLFPQKQMREAGFFPLKNR